MSLAILYDSSICIGCRECEKACAARWKLPYNDAIAAEEQISAHKLTAIQTHGARYSRRLCMHCADPTCVSVCPVGALKKTALGPVVYDQTKCIGCRYCMLACPFQVPTYEWSSRLPIVRKCDMCYERVSHGKPTACTEACPTGATMCGDRDALIAEARAAHPREAGSVLRADLRRGGSGRHVGAVSFGGAVRATRHSDESSEYAVAHAHVESVIAHAGHRFGGRHVVGGRLLDHASP